MAKKVLSIILILIALSSGVGVSFVFIDTARNLSIHVSDISFSYDLVNQTDGYEFQKMEIGVNLTIENYGRAKMTSILATVGVFFTSNITLERISIKNDSRSLGTVSSKETKSWRFLLPINESFLNLFKDPGVLRIDFLIDAKVSFGIQTAVTYLIPAETLWSPPR